ncbi:hypothetical protein LEMA_P100050.1 [Plenodomus lingam JN3]|uniref:Uncharacterized protein n=2 Tax=Leptosphaeria maculans TaxID=5022 RepID=E5A014_LEPMJ|nr:hypothetical protein LEMA_P100050.1 [Plenodomus lingam JN3]CBX96874.1 hypothetical protein LEMA_P100050.1 [Plenodomus lingam JN3]
MGLQMSLALAGNAILSNRCSYDIWVWSVGESSSSGPIYIPARSQYSEPFRNAGTSFKISKTNQLVSGAHTQFEYSIVNNNVWFDISLVDCAKGENASACPGQAEGLAMDSPNAACGRISCAPGSYCPTQAYFVDTPVQKLGLAEPVFACPGASTNLDLYMKMCANQAPIKRSVAGRLMAELGG